ncbi:carbohydrate ABC transporter permease [Saccharopolyspora flava]|uniref:Raffinose/stachyose/melibiose transport system permease protein n=1 Tax=Saccharopolyspora flava TaxID=95161 RepID=A0A1I6SPP2_9PSEU|nr:sugar ABC transporter permease [Saccharopolyspora flava]SFS78914.1 raffinose/stachyose/melibiose transport system permease protein [Saccharopolyspora flava]
MTATEALRPTAPAPAPRQRRPARHWTEPSTWFAAPALLFFAALVIAPIVVVVVLSLMDWNGISSPEFNAGENWAELATDSGMWHSVWVSLQVMILCWVVQTPISILLGVYVAGKQKSRAVLAALFFLPLVLSSTGIGIVWRNLVDPEFGVLPALGLPGLNLLGDEHFALYTLIFVVSWQFIPFHTLLYQAGVRQIPAPLYEAAVLDGAGPVQQFFRITLPQLRNTVVTSSTLMLVGSLTYFDLFYVLSEGGPGDATRILPVNMYVTGFQQYQLGYASAIALFLVALGTALSLGLTKYSGFARMRSDQEGA